jgi:hypothetical protein
MEACERNLYKDLLLVRSTSMSVGGDERPTLPSI